MLFTRCIHPQILHALGTLGHGSRILISDGGYPHLTGCPDHAAKVYLNFSQGRLLVTEVLEVLKEIVPIEKASVMTPVDGSSQPIHEEFKKIIPDVPFENVKKFDFYDLARERNTGLLIATGDTRNFANLLLTVGVIRHPDRKGA